MVCHLGFQEKQLVRVVSPVGMSRDGELGGGSDDRGVSVSLMELSRAERHKGCVYVGEDHGQ